MLLNATSSTILGSTSSLSPCSRMVCARNHCVISAISASVSPENALPIFARRSPSHTANV